LQLIVLDDHDLFREGLCNLIRAWNNVANISEAGNAYELFSKVREIKYDVILLSGDLAQSPCEESYNRILKIVESYQLPVLCLPGNHDDFPLMQHLFNTPTIHCQKQVVFGHWQIILLNSQIVNSEFGHLAHSDTR
jgi:3',5'-cyclic AMP phosphodiesterase CpdA